MRRIVAAVASVATVAAVVGFGFASPAVAAGAAISVTPASATALSGAATTFTLTISCSVSGGCAGTTATFPTTAVTGNGTRTDFGGWLANVSCPGLSVGGGQATVAFGAVPTGSRSCTFTVTPPEYLTLNGATATITPTLRGSNFDPVTGAAATLTASAGHNASLQKSAPASVAAGGTFAYALIFHCGNLSYQGDVGLASVTTTDTLPANFTYTSYTAPAGLPGTFNYDAATRTFTYADPNGTMCQSNLYKNGPNGANEVIIYLNGTASTAGVANPTGTTMCNTAASSFTYLDGTSAGSTSAQVCPVVTNLVPNPFLQKTSGATTNPNLGQHVFSPDPTTKTTPYTFPGDWDHSGKSVLYNVYLYTNSPSAGANFAVRDPLPCLDNYAGQIYSSPAPGGPYCANPAVIPTLITTTGFPVGAADAITLVHTDGSTSTVPYTAGTGWIIPTTPAVAEIDFPRFAEEGANTTGQYVPMVFTIQGYAAATAHVDSLLTNTVTATAYAVGSSTPLLPAETSSASVLVADPADPNGTMLRPVVQAGYAGVGSCREYVGWNLYGGTTNAIELTTAPSRAIYIDYLAPADSTVISNTTLPFTARQVHDGGGYGLQQIPVSGGPVYTTAALAATVTADYHGTGRTLYEWVIPAGLITVPGEYQIFSGALTVALPAGCAGTYQNDLTVGYAAPVLGCYYGGIGNPNFETPAPRNPDADDDLTGNGVGTGNYCGFSSPVTVAPVNPGYSVSKTVQGNLDPAPVAPGGVGNVSPTGGTATYQVTFTNTGQANLTDPVLYDLLPRVGDTQASSTTPRNSGYAVSLTGLGVLPAGVTVSYSQATNPCRPEVLPTNPGCTDDWSTTAPADLSSVTALRFAYSGTVYVNGAGTSTFSVPFTVSTPATPPGKIAWNSVGTSVFAGDTRMPAAESSPTGLQAEAGPRITKSASTPTYNAIGETITYTYTVTNTTAVALTNVGVTDNLTDAASGAVAPAASCQALTSPAATCSGATTTLQPGQVATFTASYTVTGADLDHGRITDTATTTAQPPTGGPLTATSGPVTVTAAQHAALSLRKSATPATVARVGDQVTYRFDVSNTGNVTLTGIAVKEASFSGTGALSAVSCPAASLAAGQQETCTATYAVSQADLDAGSITNTATAGGTAPGGQPVTSAPSTATVAVTQTPALTLRKSADPSGGTSYRAGQPLTYHYLVTNTGNTAVSAIAIHEDSFSGTGTLSAVTCPATVLAAGAEMDCTATYTLTQPDIDSGALTNTATVTGRGPGGQPVSDQSTVTTPQAPNAVLTLTKAASPATVGTAGDRVGYTFTVANGGNVTIGNVGIEETSFTGSGTLSAITCPLARLVPGQQETCTATYAVSQPDLDAGSITNTARATGTAAGGAAVTSDPSSATVSVAQHSGLSLVKSADPSGGAAYRAGQPLTYHYVVGNTGNVTVDAIAISEDNFTGTGTLSAVSCPSTTLAPGAQMDCTASYTLTQLDIESGRLVNTATATGLLPDGRPVSAQSTVSTPQVAAPALALAKSADPATVGKAGDPVTYRFAVQNTGNVSVDQIRIEETAFSGTGALSAITCPLPSLLPGQQETCTATYAVTQSDVDAGLVTNKATAAGVAAGGAPVASGESTATLTVTQQPALTLTKSATPATVASVGQQVRYTFTVVNSGNVTMTGIAIRDGAFTGSGTLSAITCPATPLAPGAQLACTATYSVTQRDLDAGTISNTATAAGHDPGGDARSSVPSTATVAVSAKPALTLVKSASPTTVSAAGQRIDYRFAVTNTGNVTLTALAVREQTFTGNGKLSAITCPATPLAPGAVLTCTAGYDVTAADLTAHTISNTAVATATSGPAGDPRTVVSDPSTVNVTVDTPAAPPASPGPAAQGDSRDLASTGTDAGALLGGAVVLLLAGVFVLIAARRRRS